MFSHFLETSWDPSKADMLEGTPVEGWLAVPFPYGSSLGGRQRSIIQAAPKEGHPGLGLRALSTPMCNLIDSACK